MKASKGSKPSKKKILSKRLKFPPVRVSNDSCRKIFGSNYTQMYHKKVRPTKIYNVASF